MLTSATQVSKRPLKFHFRAPNVRSAEAAQLLPPSKSRNSASLSNKEGAQEGLYLLDERIEGVSSTIASIIATSVVAHPAGSALR